MLFAQEEKMLFVACANSNSVAVIDLEEKKTREIITSSLFPTAPVGSTPNSIALSPDGRALLVANADNNNLAVFDVERAGHSRSRSASSRSAGIRRRSASTARRAEFCRQRQGADVEGERARSEARRASCRPTIREYIGGLFQGTLVDRLPPPSPADWRATRRRRSSAARSTPSNRRGRKPIARRTIPIPAKVGDPEPDQALHLHHQGEPHLRPGLRRHARGQRRPEPLHLSGEGHAEPPRARRRVRAARQLLRGERSERRRPRVEHGRLRHRLRREDLAAASTAAAWASSSIPAKGAVGTIASVRRRLHLGPLPGGQGVASAATASSSTTPPSRATRPRRGSSRSKATSIPSSTATTSTIPT